MQIEDFDIRLEEIRLRSLQRELEMQERQGLAVQAALAEHSVTSYVRNLPVEDASYPAIEYLKLAQQGEGRSRRCICLFRREPQDSGTRMGIP